MKMNIQEIYQETIKYATLKHQENRQTIPDSDLPYVVHLSNVAMELFISYINSADFDLQYAMQVALLHDVLEDTSTTLQELEAEFGKEIAEGVLALTKNDHLLKEEKVPDSLMRIRLLRKEVWAVKLADRITNLQKPPVSWDNEKKARYLNESVLILDELTGGNFYLENRLKEKIEMYKEYIE